MRHRFDWRRVLFVLWDEVRATVKSRLKKDQVTTGEGGWCDWA